MYMTHILGLEARGGDMRLVNRRREGLTGGATGNEN